MAVAVRKISCADTGVLDGSHCVKQGHNSFFPHSYKFIITTAIATAPQNKNPHIEKCLSRNFFVLVFI
jgi:hypothetical protein